MWSLDSINKVGELVAAAAVAISPKMLILYLFMGP